MTRLVIGEGTEHALELKNRVIMAPLTRGRSSVAHVPNDMNVEYYRQRAGAGLIISEATGISQRHLGWFKAPGIWNDEQTAAWTKIVDEVHAEGGKIYIQLWAMGRQGHSDVFKGQPFSASAVPMEGEVTAANHEKKAAEVPHPLTVDEIAKTVKQYGIASANAKKAGADGVEIHAGNGYLLDQFMQSKTNKREDDYGGSAENRLRIVREVVEEVFKVFPKERVGIRLSPNGKFGEMGSADNQELFSSAIEWLAKQGIGYIHVMNGLGFGFHELCEQMTAKQVREIIRKASERKPKSVAFFNVGYSKESGEKELQESESEGEIVVESAIVFGRPFISNPDLPRRFAEDLPLAEDPPYEIWWNEEGPRGYIDYPKNGESMEIEKVVNQFKHLNLTTVEAKSL